MKKFVLIGMFLMLVFLVGCAERVAEETQRAEQKTSKTSDVCTKKGTNESLRIIDAIHISMDSECSQGELKETAFCNENTGTWWIDLDIEKEGCSPACVIDVATQQAEINWRCTGALP